jgi:hypothetical protein
MGGIVFGYYNENMLMKPNSLASLPIHLPEPSLASLNTRLHRQRTEIIQLPLATPPDEIKVRELNALAGKHPFCVLYKARKHDML